MNDDENSISVTLGDVRVHPSSNQTSASAALDVTQADDVTMIAFVAFTSVCILATIVGNVLVVLSIFTYRPLRGVQNYYIVSLACADLAVAIFVMPFNVADSVAGHWQFEAAFCNVWLTFDILMCTASILNLCAIAGDRFFAIHDPINYAQKRTLRRVLAVIGIVWLASAIISIPPLFGWNNSSSNSSSLYDEVNRSCQLTDEPGYVLYSASGSFYIPLVIMAFLYAKIYRATRQRLRKRSSTCVQTRSSGQKRRTANGVEDATTPNAEGNTPPPLDRNGSTQPGKKVCHDRGAVKVNGETEKVNREPEKVNGDVQKKAEELLRDVEKGGHRQGEERRASTSKENLKHDCGGCGGGGSVTRDSLHRPLRAGNSDNSTVTKSSAETQDNSCNKEKENSARNKNLDGSITVRDGNGNVDGGGNKLTNNKDNGTVLGGNDRTVGEGMPNQGGCDLPPVGTGQSKSNGASSKKTRSRTKKNSLRISSSMPRRGSRPPMLQTVSVLNATNRAQSENWTKAETRLRPLAMKPLRWTHSKSSSTSASPSPVTRGGSSRLSQILENRQKISLSKERRAARTMAVVMGAFVLCWLPFFLMYVIFPFCESCRKNTDRRVKNFIVWLGYVNSALNPVIYTIFNIDFRRAFKSLLQGNCKIIA